ncbi:MAG TPA: hypothetical protein VGW38_04985 [Chloroflexota bacterium]|nr:hypothetical protein [Chloroflexota bacterium]
MRSVALGGAVLADDGAASAAARGRRRPSTLIEAKEQLQGAVAHLLELYDRDDLPRRSKVL